MVSREHRGGCFKDVNVSSVTLIGDAAHLMPPYSGIGVNLAMTDAYELSEAISSTLRESEAPDKAVISRKLRTFERDMFTRSKQHAIETAQNQEMMYSEDSAQRLKAFLAGASEAAPQ